ncbi:MAG: NTP transferase domain-containing protein [Bacteroidetes Order II. Incertae sedis bacterium]|nr:NTP transferase domain-containing protein [Bacteroidetes Order II. bacterium]MBT4052185.1 NTP transferase domain-containing protein [Bacteroidetes Order II. bacterium]MBT4602504.1 NTP transferase domain-containing protein [Bacteroidetes Order II. bacterium]MBT5249016.1 NTP transferase domain-containing protein [Bacteroidetes Order II. bacterium]MBT6201093.1 NTP transferase domain-containing protein [Bacteroidetes Order II. bacterium]
MKLIIPMAGRGTRVRPHSHVTPKPLLPVCGKSMVERIVDTFSAVLPRPITEAVFVLGPDFGQEVRDSLTDICERHGAKAHFATQDVALGTAHAVGCAGDHLEGEGIMVFADTLFYMDPGVDLTDADVVAWVKHVEDPSRFGVAVRDGDRIVELVEKPQELISTEALIGIYYCREFKQLRSAIQYLFDHNITGVGDEYQLTDAFDLMLKDDKVFKTTTVTEWLDCGTIEALSETTEVILRMENHSADIEGMTIHNPVYVGPGVTVEGGEIGPFVSIEAGSTIRNSTVSHSIVFGDALVEDSELEGSLVGHHAQVKSFEGSLNVGDHSEVKGTR